MSNLIHPTSQITQQIMLANLKQMMPESNESVDFNTSQNLFIEGDNLAVLNILQKHSRIKMIYILTHLYNTGNDRFVWADDFSESIADYKVEHGKPMRAVI